VPTGAQINLLKYGLLFMTRPVLTSRIHCLFSRFSKERNYFHSEV